MRITDKRLNQSRALQPGVFGPADPNAPLKDTWRTKWRQALFRDAMFFVEVGTRASGRRVAVHEYPKRNMPYAEDMGRSAQTFAVTGYIIGPFYHLLKDKLIDALEADGPGRLRLPMAYQLSDVNVMVQQYSISEARERGGMCAITMQFVEFGEPEFRENISTPGQIMQGAQNVEAMMMRLETFTSQLQKEMEKFAQIHKEAELPNSATTLNQSAFEG